MLRIPRARRFSLAVGLLSLAMAGAAHAQGNDTIEYKNGKSSKVAVSTEDYDGVTFTLGGGKSMAKWKDVDSVRYGGALEFYKAIDAASLLKFADAKPLLEKLAADDKLRAPLRQSALYHLGLTQLRLGDAKAAIATFDTLFQAFPKGRYLFPGANLQVSAYLSTKDVAGANKSVEAVISGMKKAEVEASYITGFAVLRGRILEQQGEFDKAQKEFDSV